MSKHLLDRNHTAQASIVTARFAALQHRVRRHPAISALWQRRRPHAGARQLAFLRLAHKADT